MRLHAQPTPGRTAGKREWIGLAVIALPCLLYGMDLTVLNLALPAVSADLEPTGTELLWVVDIYGFLLAGLLVTMGALGDRIGHRRMLLLGVIGFGAASLMAAFATSALMLIVARGLLGIAAATLAPSTLSLVRNMFADQHQRTIAIGVWITSFSVGGAIGPLVGGLLLEHFWWGSVFLLAIPVTAVLVIAGPRLLPEFRAPHSGRLDLLSAALSLVAVLAIVFGLKQSVHSGLGLVPISAILAGVLGGAAFARRQLALPDPLIDLELLRTPAFSAALVTNTLAFFVAFGAFLFLAQYLQLVLELSPLHAGLWTAPSAVGFIVGSSLAPRAVRRMQPASVMIAGFALAAAGFAVLSQLGGSSGLATLVTGSMLFSLGISQVFTLGTDLMVGSAPPEQAGQASGIAETSSELGGALGIAVLGMIGTAVYRAQVAAVIPEDVPPQVAEAASDTPGNAVEIGETVGGHEGSELVHGAQEAFAQAMQATASVSLALALLAAGVAALFLRRASESAVAGDLDAGLATSGDTTSIKRPLGTASGCAEATS